MEDSMLANALALDFLSPGLVLVELYMAARRACIIYI